MKNPKTKAILIAILGLILALASIYGYDLGIARRETFGAFQWAGTILGVILLIYGILQLRKRN